MRISFIKSKVIISVVLVFTIHSCVSVDRKIKINSDGTGSETVKIIFQKEFYELMSSMASVMDSTRRQGFLDSLYNDDIFINKTRGEYDSAEGITVTDIFSQRDSDSSNALTIKFDFDSVKKIGYSFNKMSESKGKVFVNWEKEGGNISFRYDYSDSIPEGIYGNDSLTALMKNSLTEMFGSGKMHFEIDFPYEIISSNATSSEGSNLTWDYNISDIIISGKLNLEALMKEK